MYYVDQNTKFQVWAAMLSEKGNLALPYNMAMCCIASLKLT